MSGWTLLRNKYTGDVQEFVPGVVDNLIGSGAWERVQQAATPVSPAVETASMRPSIGEAMARITRPIFSRGPSSRA